MVFSVKRVIATLQKGNERVLRDKVIRYLELHSDRQTYSYQGSKIFFGSGSQYFLKMVQVFFRRGSVIDVLTANPD